MKFVDNINVCAYFWFPLKRFIELITKKALSVTFNKMDSQF